MNMCPTKLKNTLWDVTYGSQSGEGLCYVCEGIINSKRFEAGHIISVFYGGDTTLENLIKVINKWYSEYADDDKIQEKVPAGIIIEKFMEKCFLNLFI